MPPTMPLFSRLFNTVFAAGNRAFTRGTFKQAGTTAPAASAAPTVIGQGASNEVQVLIAGTPNLFVDEGNHVVQFRPAFEEQLRDTEFGAKVLPELIPYWKQVCRHDRSLKEAVSYVIRGEHVPPPSSGPNEAVRTAARTDTAVDPECAGSEPASAAHPTSSATSTVVAASNVTRGKILSWGEEKFPSRDGKKPHFYTSFAIRLQLLDGQERTLQGEGLKEAINDCGCVAGDVVSVRRLRKIKVPAFRRDGSPKLIDGKQVMWDKWLWSIQR